ncbi:MAG: hypothetical protein FJ306_04850 [Planctomycetes bacterium]|nr:hypothetical protein [Planctomycetota bacterium]
MSLFDFFFPDQAQATHLRRIADQSARSERRRNTASREAKATFDSLQRQVDELRGDIGFTALVLGALVARLDEKGVVTRADLQAAMARLDLTDDLADGTLDVERLKAVVAPRPDGASGSGS